MALISLTYWEFDLLFWKMATNWKKDTNPPEAWSNSIVKMTGYPTTGKEKSQPPPEGFINLCGHINLSKDVKRRGFIPSTYFYPRMLKISKSGDPDAPLELEEVHLNLFLDYLSYTSLDDFRQATSRSTEYTGYYFSQTLLKVTNFKLWITARSHIERMHFSRRQSVTVEDFYDNIHDDVKLKGDLRRLHKCWTAQLENGENFMQLSIFMGKAETDLERVFQFDQLFGTIATISKEDHLINVECVFAKTTVSAEANLTIERYLNVRRNYFSIEATVRDQQSMEALMTGDVPLGDLEPLAHKTFRIIAQGPHGYYMQSRFRINDDYSAVIAVPVVEQGRELHCRLLIDNINKGTLLVYSYIRHQNSRIYTVAAIESLNKEKGPILEGSYFIVNNQYGKLAGYRFVLMEDKSSFALTYFKSQEMTNWDRGDVRHEMMEKLRK
jgi:hypothetical protein